MLSEALHFCTHGAFHRRPRDTRQTERRLPLLPNEWSQEAGGVVVMATLLTALLAARLAAGKKGPRDGHPSIMHHRHQLPVMINKKYIYIYTSSLNTWCHDNNTFLATLRP